MAAYKPPSFNERVATARAAKQSALDKLRNKAADPAVIAQREAARAAHEAAAPERRLAAEAAKAAVAAREAARAERRRAAEAAKAAATIPAPEDDHLEALPPARPPPDEAERKAARDARYAARKARKR